MAYQFSRDCNAKEFDEYVISSDQNSLFQGSKWARIKSNWDSCLTAVYQDGHIVAAGLVLIRRMPMGTTLFYIPRGPVMDYHDHALVSYYFDEVRKMANERHAIAIRFDPAIISRKYKYKDRADAAEYQNNDVIEFLKSLGARHKGMTIHIAESTQPRFNAEMDVAPNYRDQLEHKTAKCIRISEQKGVKILRGHEYAHELAVAMHYTEVRKKVALRNEDYFRNMMDIYGDQAICMVTELNIHEQLEKLSARIRENEEKCTGKLSKKEHSAVQQQIENDKNELAKLQADRQRETQDQIVTCGILAVYNKNLMELFYMGNNPDYLRMYSSYLLYAACLDECVRLGISRCSFGGIEGTLDDGLTLFKSNWPMDVVEYIGEFNIVLNKPIYYAFDRIYPFILKTAAKIRGKEQTE